MQFNETLALLRKSRGFTQEQLAEQLGVSRQAIARWKSGETAPDVYILRDLSEIFGISADGLLNGVDEIPPSAAVKDSPAPQTVSEDAAPPEPPAKTAASVRSKLIFAAAVIAIAAVTVTANVGIIKFSGMNSTGAKNIYSPIGADSSGLTSLSNAAKTEFWTAEEYEKWAEEQLGIYRKKFESGEKILWHKGGGDTSSALTEDDMKNIENALSKTLSAIKDGDLFTKDESFS